MASSPKEISPAIISRNSLTSRTRDARAEARSAQFGRPPTRWPKPADGAPQPRRREPKDQPAKTGPLGGREDRGHRAEDPRPRDRPQEDSAERSNAARSHDGRPGLLDEATVGHARWTDRLAGAAGQTAIEVQNRGVVPAQIDPTVRDRSHEMEASAR